jgi:hypothetical protein
LLEAVRDGDFVDVPVDNEMPAAALRLPLTAVALVVQEAEARSQLRGIRSDRQPAPWHAQLELTVHGRRFFGDRDVR